MIECVRSTCGLLLFKMSHLSTEVWGYFTDGRSTYVIELSTLRVYNENNKRIELEIKKQGLLVECLESTDLLVHHNGLVIPYHDIVAMRSMNVDRLKYYIDTYIKSIITHEQYMLLAQEV